MTHADASAGPLAGIRVLDFGMYWAGPFAGKWLGDAGAEVIKIESTSRPDNLRILARDVYPNGEPGPRPWNRSGMINDRNRSKLGITLDMRSDEGREVFRELVAVSDVVLHNFSTKVMAGWGIDYDSLREMNPRIVLASIYSQGGEGPESGFVSFGGTLEQIGGLTALNGYAGEIPGVFTLQLPDPFGGAMAAALIVAALRRRRITGVGAHIDLSQRENLTALLGPMLLDYQMNLRTPAPQGNRDANFAPQGVYRCAGEDAWVVISVRDDQDWVKLCGAIGQPEAATDRRFLTVLGRHDHHDQIDDLITAWTSMRSKGDAAVALQTCGVPAGIVADAADLFNDPHLSARAFWEGVEDPDGGYHRYAGRGFRLSRTPLRTRRPAPMLGQHNEDVLRGVLGKSESEVQHLEEAGVIGTEPTEDARRGKL